MTPSFVVMRPPRDHFPGESSPTRCYYFDSPDEVAAFMWGRDVNDWAIYASVGGYPVEVSELEAMLILVKEALCPAVQSSST